MTLSRPSPWTVAAGAISAALGLPLVVVVWSLRHPAVEVWAHLWRTQLPELIVNTLVLLGGVGAGTLLLGTALARLVVTFRFPGRAFFEWALVLPLAVPAYVIGFAFLGLFDFSGPVQSALRGWLGPGVRVPDPRSGGGVILVMTLVFYPYVYLLARTAFREHGRTTTEAARSLGRTRRQAFLQVVLPMARPSLVAGTSLAMMEALADFGTVSTFGYRTLTEAVYRVWTGMFDRIAATQLACLLLFLALSLLGVERGLRGRRRFTQSHRRGTGPLPVTLRGWAAAAATGACGAVLLLAFVLPMGQMAVWGLEAARDWPAAASALLDRLASTLLLAGLAAVTVCLLAVTLGYAVRLHPSPVVRFATRFASLGYALPGAVIAVGVLAPIAWVDHRLGPVVERVLGPGAGLLLTGSIAAVLFAYAVRFLTVGLQTVEASLGRIPPSLDESARSLGTGTLGILRRIHVPLVRGGVLTALVLVWVETMKELPATLLLRPLGLKTLAIEVWERTSESMWAEAALPALAIIVVGLVPLAVTARMGARPDRSGP